MQTNSNLYCRTNTQLPPIFAKFFEGCTVKEKELRKHLEKSSESEEEEETNGTVSSAEESTDSLVAVGINSKGNATQFPEVIRNRRKAKENENEICENSRFQPWRQCLLDDCGKKVKRAAFHLQRSHGYEKSKAKAAVAKCFKIVDEMNVDSDDEGEPSTDGSKTISKAKASRKRRSSSIGRRQKSNKRSKIVNESMGDFLGRRVTRSFTAKVTVDECEMQEKQESEESISSIENRSAECCENESDVEVEAIAFNEMNENNFDDQPQLQEEVNEKETIDDSARIRDEDEVPPQEEPPAGAAEIEESPLTGPFEDDEAPPASASEVEEAPVGATEVEEPPVGASEVERSSSNGAYEVERVSSFFAVEVDGAPLDVAAELEGAPLDETIEMIEALLASTVHMEEPPTCPVEVETAPLNGAYEAEEPPANAVESERVQQLSSAVEDAPTDGAFDFEEAPLTIAMEMEESGLNSPTSERFSTFILNVNTSGSSGTGFDGDFEEDPSTNFDQEAQQQLAPENSDEPEAGNLSNSSRNFQTSNFAEILLQTNAEYLNRVNDLFAVLQQKNTELARRESEATIAWHEVAYQLYSACQSLSAAVCIPFEF